MELEWSLLGGRSPSRDSGLRGTQTQSRPGTLTLARALEELCGGLAPDIQALGTLLGLAETFP